MTDSAWGNHQWVGYRIRFVAVYPSAFHVSSTDGAEMNTKQSIEQLRDLTCQMDAVVSRIAKRIIADDAEPSRIASALAICNYMRQEFGTELTMDEGRMIFDKIEFYTRHNHGTKA